MRFELTATSVWWNETEQLIDQYPFLHKYGFEIEEIRNPRYKRIHDENGKLIVFQDENDYSIEKKAYITINSLDELIQFIDDCYYAVIVGEDHTIEIYDGYRE